MGTALVLLFLLALAAIPGALLPQRSLNEFKVDQYIAEHPTIGPWLDRLQAFDVFSSFWFTAIYRAAVRSLVVPYTAADRTLPQHAGQPRPAPRNLSRAAQTPRGARGARRTPSREASAVATLSGWRRLPRDGAERRRRPAATSSTEISAEKGYLREFGNIVFPLLSARSARRGRGGRAAIYSGLPRATSWSPSRRPGFCSRPCRVDWLRAGNTVDDTRLPPDLLRQRLSAPISRRGGHVVPRHIDYRERHRPRLRHLAALSAQGLLLVALDDKAAR